jgi:hypothetical protein
MTISRTTALLGVAAALLLGGCGGDAGGAEVASAGGTAATAAPTEESEQDQDEQALAFAECLRENGLDVPDPEPGQRGGFGGFGALGEDVDEETVRAAMDACRDLAPTFDRERDLTPEQQEQLLELTECLREQGIDVPDPGAGGFGGGGGGGGGLGDVDREALDAAREACRDVLDLPAPTGAPGAGAPEADT